jgi:hypothetical protein
VLDDLKGRADYYTKPWLRSGKELYSMAWRGVGPMNGQCGRRDVTASIIRRADAQAIVETGSYRGVTTAWLASFGLPVVSVELNPRLYGYAAMRLRHHHNVSLMNRSSECAIEDIAHDQCFPKDRVFFYLDAHWDADVPLRQELQQVFSSPWVDPIVMIDDFAVPGDSYGYLDRGPGKRLTVDILGEYINLPRWYPAMPAWRESGTNTGWTVVTAGMQSVDALDSIEGLRRSDVPVAAESERPLPLRR